MKAKPCAATSPAALSAATALLALCMATAASAVPLEPGAAIDVAGRQRMLSQRIVKAYELHNEQTGAGRQMSLKLDQALASPVPATEKALPEA